MAALDEVCCARVPRSSLASLAELRTSATVTVIDGDAERVWLRWPAGNAEVLRRVLPLAGVELYRRSGGQWFRAESRLPAEGPPDVEACQLDRVLQPAPFLAVPPAGPSSTVLLRLVRDAQPRSATALRCSLAVLAEWADRAPTADITALRGACLGTDALLLGERLPWFADGERFWGRRVLVPLGWHPEPFLPESALVEVLDLGANRLAVLREDGVEIIAATVLQPLTRGAIRRACPRGKEAPA